MPALAGIYPPLWSTTTISARIPPVSPSLTASTICAPTGGRSWWVSRMTHPPLRRTPLPIGGDGRSGPLSRSHQLLILSDTGGSNGARRRTWKTELQSQLADSLGLTLTVAHYPTGASKWNPIEHRLFSEISKNWAGEPLDSYQKILTFIRSTRTKTGLSVTAQLDRATIPPVPNRHPNSFNPFD